MGNQFEDMERAQKQNQQRKLYLVVYRESDYRETWEKVVAVFVSKVAPDVLLIKSGAIYESNAVYADEASALRWWVQNGEYVNPKKDFSTVTTK